MVHWNCIHEFCISTTHSGSLKRVAGEGGPLCGKDAALEEGLNKPLMLQNGVQGLEKWKILEVIPIILMC